MLGSRGIRSPHLTSLRDAVATQVLLSTAVVFVGAEPECERLTKTPTLRGPERPKVGYELTYIAYFAY